METSPSAANREKLSRRRKRSAVKCKKAIVFSDSESDSEIDVATYRELKTDWTRLRRKVNNGMRREEILKEKLKVNSRETKRLLEDVEKSILVTGLRSEVKHCHNRLKEANLIFDDLSYKLSTSERRLRENEIYVKGVKDCWRKKSEEASADRQEIADLRLEIERLRKQVIPYVHQVTLSDLQKGKRLVQMASSGVKVDDLLL